VGVAAGSFAPADFPVAPGGARSAHLGDGDYLSFARRLGAGEFLAIEPGTLHSLHNPGPSWAHALTWVAPGRQHVRFFEQLGEPLDDPMNPPQPEGPPDVEELTRVARECGMEFKV